MHEPCQSKLMFNRSSVCIGSYSYLKWFLLILLVDLQFKNFLPVTCPNGISLGKTYGEVNIAPCQRQKVCSFTPHTSVSLLNVTLLKSAMLQCSRGQSNGKYNEVHTVSPCIFFWSETVGLFPLLYPGASHDTKLISIFIPKTNNMSAVPYCVLSAQFWIFQQQSTIPRLRSALIGCDTGQAFLLVAF